jgi:hypothetical protein
LLQHFGEKRIQWDGLLRRLRFAEADHLHHHGAGDADFVVFKTDVSPLQGEEFAQAQAGSSIQKYKCAFPQTQGVSQPLDLAGAQNGWDLLPFCTMAHQLDWISANDSMIKRPCS